jgi:hypothetical protein
VCGRLCSVLTLCVVDYGVQSLPGQRKEYKIGICCFCAKHVALREKNKDWLALNQLNVFEWCDLCTHGRLFH